MNPELIIPLQAIIDQIPLQPYLAATLDEGLASIIKILQKISIVLFFGGLIHGAVSYAFGRPEAIKTSIIGAGLGVLAWVILDALQSAILSTDSIITIP